MRHREVVVLGGRPRHESTRAGFADRELASTEAELASIEACLSIAAAEVPSPEAELASIEADLSIPARELPSRQAELPSKVALHASPSSRQPMPRPDRPTRDREWSASGSGVDREARNCASGHIKLGTKEGARSALPIVPSCSVASSP